MTLPTICILPWISLETAPDGAARPCCLYDGKIKDENGVEYNLKKDTLDTVYKSGYMQKLRQDFRNGTKPEACRRCWAEEGAGRTSKRMHMIRRHGTKSVDIANDKPDQLWFIDLKLGNICNLKCRICGGWSSSAWATEDYTNSSLVDPRTHVAYKWLKQGQWPKDNAVFWDNMKAILPHIKYFEITGGEPFMIKEHFELLEFAIDNGYAGNIEIHYNTNGTHYPEEHVWMWEYFKSVEIAFSIDNVGDKFEYERSGAKWDDVVKNITKFHLLRHVSSNIRTQVCMTISALNILYLKELCDWVNTQNFDYDYFNLLHDPSYFCITQLPDDVKNIIDIRLTTRHFSPEHRKEVEHILGFMMVTHRTGNPRLIDELKKIDLRRNQCLTDSHTELAEMLNYPRE